MTGFQIDGIGTAAPNRSLDQQKAVDLARLTCRATKTQQRLLPQLYRRTSVQQRGSVLFDDAGETAFYPPAQTETDPGPTTAERIEQYNQQAPRLACEAASAAIQDADIKPGDITDLITVSCTGFASPGVDYQLIKQLELPPTVSRTNIGFMGCHGAFNGLRVARGIAAANPDAHVLICCVELCSLHLSYGWDPQRIVANALFADGAGAVVGSAGQTDWSLIANGSCVMPDSEDLMTWHIGDHGFEMTLSPRVPDVICKHLPGWLSDWLAQHELDISRINSWAVHPGGPRIVAAVADSLSIPNDSLAASLDVLAGRGNMSSPTILFILERLRAQGAQLPCVALGFGPGLTVEAFLLA